MMSKIHIANTFLESELLENAPLDLHQTIHSHPVYLQLQFLPLLYRKPSDGILVTDLPSLKYQDVLKHWNLSSEALHLIDTPSLEKYDQITDWGASRSILNWAAAHQIPYWIPEWDVVKEINSKAFSFLHSPKLPGARLISSKEELIDWLKHLDGPKVLKTCYGVSGRGHFIINPLYPVPENKILSFAQKQWSLSLPIIAEPWVSRLLDFSTQWEIFADRSVHFIGTTLCESNARGQYLLNRAGKTETLMGKYLPLLKEHQEHALPVLQKMAERGHRGNVGIDAMIYLHPTNQSTCLHPIVEINARKTMGWACLQFQQRRFPNRELTFSYVSNKQGILPSSIQQKGGKQMHFNLNLSVEIC